jgi:hypothetical protein
MVTFASAQPAGTTAHIETEGGEEALTCTPTKAYLSGVFSSAKLKCGTTYQVYTGGSSNGTVTDGLTSGGTYTGGPLADTFTISGIVTYAGSAGAGAPGGPTGGRMFR